MTDDPRDLDPVDPRDLDPVSAWRRLAGTSVLLDGFHALKHAVRFRAEIPLAVTADRQAALALADDLAPDVRDTLDALLTEVPQAAYEALVPRPHPTAVAALAVRPERAANLRVLARTPASRPWSSSTSRATSATRAR